MRLFLPPALLAGIEAAAEAAWPRECCGLLVGHGTEEGLRVSAVHPSANLAPDPRFRFEVDPQLCFDLMRRLRESEERIIGHYHSHPDLSPLPSAADRVEAHDPNLLWLITALDSGRVTTTRAFRLESASGPFIEVPLIVVA